MLEKALPARYLQPTEITPKSSWLTFSNPWNQVYCSHHWITWHALPTSCTADVADFLLYDRIVVHGSPCQLPADLGGSFLRSFLSVAIQHTLHTTCRTTVLVIAIGMGDLSRGCILGLSLHYCPWCALIGEWAKLENWWHHIVFATSILHHGALWCFWYGCNKQTPFHCPLVVKFSVSLT